MIAHTPSVSRSFIVLLAGGILSLAPSVQAQNGVGLPVFPRIAPYEDDFGSGGFVEVEVLSPADSIIQLQQSETLHPPRWAAVGDPIVSLGRSIVMAVPTHQGEENRPIPHRYFRFEVRSYDVGLADDGKSAVLKLGESTPTAVVLASLRRQLGTDIFPVEPFDPWSPWEAGSFEGASLDDVLARRGIRLWMTPPEKDDPLLAGRTGGRRSSTSW